MEIEIKLMLQDEAEAESLRSVLGAPASDVRQENHYFESSRYAEAGLAIRLRQRQGRLWLTVKGGGGELGNFAVRSEWEVELPADRWAQLQEGGEALENEIASLMGEDLPESAASSSLEALGSVVTRRQVFPLDHGAFHVELDQTWYPDGSFDLEVELEISGESSVDRAEAVLRQVFDQAGVPWRPSFVSKRQRFEAAVRRARGGSS